MFTLKIMLFVIKLSYPILSYPRLSRRASAILSIHDIATMIYANSPFNYPMLSCWLQVGHQLVEPGEKEDWGVMLSLAKKADRSRLAPGGQQGWETRSPLFYKLRLGYMLNKGNFEFVSK